jgi:hypothetical protein
VLNGNKVPARGEGSVRNIGEKGKPRRGIDEKEILQCLISTCETFAHHTLPFQLAPGMQMLDISEGENRRVC